MVHCQWTMDYSFTSKKNEIGIMRILITDDHTIVREGVKMLLREAYPLAEIVEASDSMDMLRAISKGKWDVIITDISMPPGDSGLEAIKTIKETLPVTPVIILSMYKPEQYAVKALKAGASGYLTKCAAALELVKAVNKVMSGRRYISEDVAGILADAFENPDTERSIAHLSERELEVFKLLASGKSVSDIAKQLILSANTVSTFRGRLLEKMKFQNNLELIKYAVDNQMV
jgi:two-component system invasion response regulator UvrY